MKHKRYLTLSSSNSPTQSPYDLGFQCPLHPDEDHMAVNRPHSGEMDSSLSAAHFPGKKAHAKPCYCQFYSNHVGYIALVTRVNKALLGSLTTITRVRLVHMSVMLYIHFTITTILIIQSHHHHHCQTGRDQGPPLLSIWLS